jgi:hypothetical protein
MKKLEYYETLCNNHNVVISNLQTLKKYISDVDARELINDTLCFVRYCKKQGQRMEDRLHSYVSAINGLGFQRVYKKKDKDWKK